MLADYAEHEQAIGLDWYALDPNLSLLFDRLLPDPDDRKFAEYHAGEYGRLVGTRIALRADETDKNGPQLRRYDKWGQPVDEIVHHATWLENKADLKRAGFVGLPENGGRPVPAVVTAALGYLVCQAETAIYCGLGMTRGAADIVERYAPAAVRDELVSRLTSLDPEESWEGGMFLTERQGGSDVGANTTRAVKDGDEWRLYGDKHFCSNVDAEIFIVLARPEGAPDGSRGLATFIVPRHDSHGANNGFHIKRLKPKLGTVGVPTGEVHLDGALAWLAAPDKKAEGVSDAARDGRGINRMMEMVNASRFGVSLMGLGIHRRSFLEAAIYAGQRQQFGHRIDSYPLVRETLVDMLVDLEAGMALSFACASAARDAAPEDLDEALLFRRIAIPLTKIRGCRHAVEAASAALEVLGGNGYMEDWPMARQLRDAQCHTIWEGTENICSIDVRRAMRGEGAHTAVLARIARALDAAASHKVLASATDSVSNSLGTLGEAITYIEGASEDMALLNVRRLAELMADTLEGALLLEEAVWAIDRDGDARKAAVARRFATRRLDARPSRGIGDPDRTVIDLFEPIVRYGAVSADDVLSAAG
jgi:alkylation response protein AidB-like acyl-CoA dehydrogenase